jgi:hypothetical protein
MAPHLSDLSDDLLHAHRWSSSVEACPLFEGLICVPLANYDKTVHGLGKLNPVSRLKPGSTQYLGINRQLAIVLNSCGVFHRITFLYANAAAYRYHTIFLLVL